MFPILFSIGKIPVSSYGVFLALGFLIGVFLIWRLSRAWDLDKEKVLDLSLLTFLGGLIGARLYFVSQHLQFFLKHFWDIIFFYKAPGFSFWGAILGGWLTLFYFAGRKKMDFWQIGDIASIGLLIGLIFSDLGCFLGGCNIGIQSKLFFAVNMVGSLGERFPVQALEAASFFVVLLKLWSSSTHFHQKGKILSLAFIFIGIIKFLLEPLRASHDESSYLSFILCILGISIFYKVTKRSLRSDLRNFAAFVYRFSKDSLTRKYIMDRLKKGWYNRKTSFFWKLRNLKKNLRRINVRVSYKNN